MHAFCLDSSMSERKNQGLLETLFAINISICRNKLKALAYFFMTIMNCMAGHFINYKKVSLAHTFSG
jgi:hypothetical protein